MYSLKLRAKAGPGFHGERDRETGPEPTSPIRPASCQLKFRPTAGFQSQGPALHNHTRDAGHEQGNEARTSWDANTMRPFKAAQQTGWIRTSRMENDFLKVQHPRRLWELPGLDPAGWQDMVT